MGIKRRRKTPQVQIGNVLIGSQHPVAIQSMTNTSTEDVLSTANQTIQLINTGSEMVRWTINNDKAARSVPKIIKTLRDQGYSTPIIGDFHYNGHILLQRHSQMAKFLEKYRINPGNVGKGKQHDKNFATIIKIAIENNKAVRIGINWGSLNKELFTTLIEENTKLAKPQTIKEVICQAMVQSALGSAEYALKLGLKKEKLVLSVKMSDLQDMVTVYSRLARGCDYALHLGVTEAGGDLQGTVLSSAALAILLQQGIGDTIRVSLTPQLGVDRAREVEICKAILQSMGLRFFAPTVTSCPGCGRTNSDYFQQLAHDINIHIYQNMPRWKTQYPGVEKLKIAVMGCVINGPGESGHADIGISLPGISEKSMALVYVDGERLTTLKENNIKENFIDILEKYIRKNFS